jgi:hypothetical protein
MEKFPKINQGQAVLLRAETNTGVVLDELFTFVINDDQKVYTLFDSVEEALESANKILKEKGKLIECTIYGEGQELIYYLNPYQIK